MRDAELTIKAISIVQDKLGFEISNEVIVDVFNYTARKLSLIGKDDSYFPVLFENELYNYFTRMAVNAGCVNYV